MGAPHGHALHYHGHSPLHRLPAHVKIVALVGYVLAVVATPSGTYWPYAAHLLALICAVLVSRVPLGHLAKRMVIEAPFVGFALVLPLVATGERVALGPVEVSQSGLEAAAALLAKGTLGVLASLLLAATTEARDIVAGFEKLRMPQPLVEIMSFMLRYTEVVAADLGRMRVARESRASGHGRCASGRLWARPWAPSSSGPTNVGSGSTWPCCRGATRAACQRSDP